MGALACVLAGMQGGERAGAQGSVLFLSGGTFKVLLI